MKQLPIVLSSCLFILWAAQGLNAARATSRIEAGITPVLAPALPVASSVIIEEPRNPSVWPILGLSGLIAIGGLLVVRKIANTIS